MWSGESEARQSRYTTDNNAVRLQTGAFLITLKIWQQNASGFRNYSNYPREVTAPALMCWGTISRAGCAIFTHILSLIIQVQSLGACPCSGFSRPKWITVAKSAKLHKSATEKRDPKKHLSLSATLRN